MRIIITGLIGQYPFGGVIWDYIQYVLGFKSLGHEVLYLEDSGAWPYNPINNLITNDCTFTIKNLNKIFSDFDLKESWSYKNPVDNKFYGLSENKVKDWLKSSDILINVSSVSLLEDYDIKVNYKIFIDGDPMFCQIGLEDGSNPIYSSLVKNHDKHYTFGLNINKEDCKAPNNGINWKTTLQPIVLDYWKFKETFNSRYWTTVMNWNSYKSKIWKNINYNQKSQEFMNFIYLPKLINQKFKIAMGDGVENKKPLNKLKSIGWNILEPRKIITNYLKYQDFLQNSFGEWSIAKHGYVFGKTGWFSCRSACYLALGRPVVLQETGWTKYLPSGLGLFSFSNYQEAIEAIEKVTKDYKTNSKKAREICEDFFDAKKICLDLL